MDKRLIRIMVVIFLIMVLQSCTSHMKIYKARLLPSQSGQPTDINPYINQSIVYYSIQEYDSAMVYLHKAFAVDSTNSIIYYYYGQLFKETGDFEKSLQSLNKALALCEQNNTKRAEIYMAIAEIELSKGDLSKAKQNYLTVLQLQPDSKDAMDALMKLNTGL